MIAIRIDDLWIRNKNHKFKKKKSISATIKKKKLKKGMNPHE